MRAREFINEGRLFLPTSISPRSRKGIAQCTMPIRGFSRELGSIFAQFAPMGGPSAGMSHRNSTFSPPRARMPIVFSDTDDYAAKPRGGHRSVRPQSRAPRRRKS